MVNDGTTPEQGPSSWWRKAVMLVLIPFVLPAVLPLFVLLGIITGLSIPFSFSVAGLRLIGEKRLRRLMRDRGRFVEWTDLASDLRNGVGTLIIEQGHKRPVRVWWTPDDVISLAPCSPPSEEELDVIGVLEPHEFVAWCCHRYTDENGGSAKLTVASLELPPGLFFAKFFKERFPLISVVDTVYCRGLTEGGMEA
jgi:hypothetical protein